MVKVTVGKKNNPERRWCATHTAQLCDQIAPCTWTARVNKRVTGLSTNQVAVDAPNSEREGKGDDVYLILHACGPACVVNDTG